MVLKEQGKSIHLSTGWNITKLKWNVEENVEIHIIDILPIL